MDQWLPAMIIAVCATIPALLTALYNYQHNKASTAEIYQVIALRTTQENEKLRQERDQIRLELEESQAETRRLRKELEKATDSQENEDEYKH